MQSDENYIKAVEALKAEDFIKALEFINRVLDKYPDQPDALSERAVIYFHLNKRDLCIIDLDRAVEIQPKNGYRFSSRAWIKDRFGNTLGAIADYEKAIQLDPEDAVSYNNLGLLQEKLGYMETANKNFNRADEISKKQGDHMFVSVNPSGIKTEADEEIKPPRKGEIIKKALFTRTGLKEFLSFLFNGFRLKK